MIQKIYFTIFRNNIKSLHLLKIKQKFLRTVACAKKLFEKVKVEIKIFKDRLTNLNSNVRFQSLHFKSVLYINIYVIVLI